MVIEHLLIGLIAYLYITGGMAAVATCIYHREVSGRARLDKVTLWLIQILWPLLVPVAFFFMIQEAVKESRHRANRGRFKA